MKNYYRFCVILCLIISHFSTNAQDKPDYTDPGLDTLLTKIYEHISAYRYYQAIEDSHILIGKAKTNKNHYYISEAYTNLGHVHYDMNDTSRAKKNYLLGKEYAELTENDTIILRAYNNLGNIYSEIPETTQIGIEYYNKVIDIGLEMGNREELIAPITNIGWTYLDNGKYEKAEVYLKNALKLMGDLDNNDLPSASYYYSQIYMLQGRYFSQMKEYDSARFYFERSVKLADQDTMILPAAEAYQAYAEMLKQEGDYKNAYEKLEKFNAYNSRLYEREKLQEMESANARFNLNEYRKDLEVAKRDQKYQEQIIDKSKEKVIVMVLSSIVLMFILFFLNKVNQDKKKLIRQLRIKNKQYRSKKDEAERLSMLKTKFFSTVSHEIRTPLYGVIGLTSLLLEDESLKKHKKDLRSLKFSADYLLALINDVLQMNKMESNEVQLESMSFNIRDLIRSIIKSFEFTRIQNKNQIDMLVSDDIPTYLMGDSVRLSQVLMNLVGNAVKFTERGKIEVIAELTNGDENFSVIQFKIKDNGPGIPESKKKVIFEEFAQLQNSNYNYQGTGLGLPLVQKLLKLFNSRVQLQSREGEGSTFSFKIKFKNDKTRLDVPADLELQKTLCSEESCKILVVDDNRINQIVTKRILEKNNFVCEVAGEGKTAVNLAKTENFDLILMDVNMPGISGLEACRQIREFDEKLPIVALTAVEVEEIREEISASGMNDIIVKPYDVQKFFQIIYKNLSIAPKAEKI